MIARRCVAAACLLVAAACSPDSTAVAPDLATTSLSSLMCQEPNPLYCGPANGNIHDGTGLGVAPSVPGDPSPGAPGIWLGNMLSGRFCYAKNNAFIEDADTDWLDDTCEYELAKAFAPTLYMSPGEYCGGGEPYWAAKLFINVEPYHWGDFVRLAYMPAYYTDCGTAGHAGDSEFIMISVQWNPGTRHWEVRDAFLSSHEGTPTDAWPLQWHSDWHTRDELRYPSTSPRYGFPEVWVAINKHANYRTRNLCDDGGATTDECDDNQALGRMRVYRDRNVGSPRLDRFPGPPPGSPPGTLGGAFSTNPHNAPLNEVSEYFYAERSFRGWQHGVPGVTPYSAFLFSENFEHYMYAAGSFWWGIPTPTHPSVTFLTGDVDGPSSIALWTNVTWTTFVTGGSAPYRAVWYRQNAGQDPNNPVHWQQVGTSTQPAGTSYTAGSFTQYQTNCEAFRIKARIFDANDQQVWDTWKDVNSTSCPPPPYMTTWITQDGNWYTANVYGGPQPYSFSWEWKGYDCGGGELPIREEPSALVAGEMDLSRRVRPSPRRPGRGRDEFPNAVSCGWQYFGSSQSVYWNQPNRILRVTVTDANGGVSVSTYNVPY